MERSLPPLTWVRAFECAARHLSFTGAAREMNITQSAVSQQVRLLENRFGTKLFVRKARGIGMTESGRRLMPYVSGAMADLTTATELFDPHQGDNVLVVVCSRSFTRLWLCRHIGVFQAIHPTCDVRIVSAVWPDDYSKVESDVQIRYGTMELVGDGAERLMLETMIPVCHPNLAPAFAENPRHYNGPLIHTIGTANTWARWTNETDMTVTSTTSLSVDSDELAIELAEHQQGVALCGEFLCREKLASGQLSRPVEASIPSEENYYLALRDRARNDARNGTLARAFCDWLESAVNQSGGA